VGAVFYYQSKIDSALYYIEMSAKIEQSLGNLSGLGTSYNNMAQILLEFNQVDNAKNYIDSAYYYAKTTKTAFDVEQALNSYVKYFERKKQPDKALQYLRQYIKVKDSILNIETNTKVAELEIQYETEKKEKEILTQRADIAEKELAINTKNYYIYGLISLAVFVAVLGYLFYSQQKLKNRQLQKENELKDALLKIETQNRLQEQRLRISRDLHDNIGAQLTFIISSLDNLKYGFDLSDNLQQKLSQISQFTTSTIYELRDTIWAMNKSEISVEDLQSRLSNFVDKARSSSQVEFEFITDTDSDISFSSVEGMNIYRIVQEAVNNAIKYAEANSIVVHFTAVGKKVVVKVQDNGKGFDTDKVSMGNGLLNMKKRASEINAHLEIESQPSSGTVVYFSLEQNK
jgi:signal transduction histidine kinase